MPQGEASVVMRMECPAPYIRTSTDRDKSPRPIARYPEKLGQDSCDLNRRFPAHDLAVNRPLLGVDPLGISGHLRQHSPERRQDWP